MEWVSEWEFPHPKLKAQLIDIEIRGMGQKFNFYYIFNYIHIYNIRRKKERKPEGEVGEAQDQDEWAGRGGKQEHSGTGCKRWGPSKRQEVVVRTWVAFLPDLQIPLTARHISTPFAQTPSTCPTFYSLWCVYIYRVNFVHRWCMNY